MQKDGKIFAHQSYNEYYNSTHVQDCSDFCLSQNPRKIMRVNKTKDEDRTSNSTIEETTGMFAYTAYCMPKISKNSYHWAEHKPEKVTMDDIIPQIRLRLRPLIRKKLIKNFNILDMLGQPTGDGAGVEILHLSIHFREKIVKMKNLMLAEYIQQQTLVRYLKETGQLTHYPWASYHKITTTLLHIS